LHQFLMPYLLLPKTLHAVLYCVGDSAHYPARFIIITQLAELCSFIIILLLVPILLIVGTSNIADPVSDTNQHRFQLFFGLSGYRSRIFSTAHIFLPLLNRCLCVLNSLSCHSGFSPHNPQSISLYLHCVNSGFHVSSPPKASF
jgi:hypothetical protein